MNAPLSPMVLLDAVRRAKLQLRAKNAVASKARWTKWREQGTTFSDSAKQKMSAAKKGSRWMFLAAESKLVAPSAIAEYEALGWSFGRR